MDSFEALLKQAEVAHGHLCAGQILGVRMAILGCSRLGIDDPRGADRKRLVTFVDLAHENRAIRVAALESSKERARELYPHVENKNQQQMLAYRELPDADLFSEQWVKVNLPPREFPGFKGHRVACSICGEGINYDRFVRGTLAEGAPDVLCAGCANPADRYYQPIA